MKVCKHCGGPIPANARASSAYCSNRCRQAAWRRRKKAGAKAAPSKKAPTAHADRVTVDVSTNVKARMDRHDFDRMMDDSYEDLLRFSRDVLKKALADSATPAGAVASIAKELLAVGRELDNQSDGGIIDFEESGGEAVADEFRPEAV